MRSGYDYLVAESARLLPAAVLGRYRCSARGSSSIWRLRMQRPRHAMATMEKAAQLAIASYCSALTTVANYYNFRPDVITTSDRQLEVTLPGILRPSLAQCLSSPRGGDGFRATSASNHVADGCDGAAFLVVDRALVARCRVLPAGCRTRSSS